MFWPCRLAAALVCMIGFLAAQLEQGKVTARADITCELLARNTLYKRTCWLECCNMQTTLPLLSIAFACFYACNSTS